MLRRKKIKKRNSFPVILSGFLLVIPILVGIPLSSAFSVTTEGGTDGKKVSSLSQEPHQPPSPSSPSLTLESFLQEVAKKHGLMKSLEASREASRQRRISGDFQRGGDIQLAPVLTTKISFMEDKKSQALGLYTLTSSSLRDYSLGVSKKFATGTQLTLMGDWMDLGMSGILIYPTPPTPFSGLTQAGSSLGLVISQSLWKDAWGKATTLRRERERLTHKAEMEGFDLQAEQIFMDAEMAFWDYVYITQEMEQREKSLGRALRIEKWVSRRLNDGIGDRSDLLNAQGLVGARQLALSVTKDSLQANQRKIEDQMEVSFVMVTRDDHVPALIGDLEKIRPLYDKGHARISREAYLSLLEDQIKSVVSQETKENLKPDLSLEGMYKTNGLDTSLSGAVGKTTDTSTPTSSLSLKFTWIFDEGNTKSSLLKTAEAESLSSRLKKERKFRESESNWSELQRRHGDLTKMIGISEKISQVQTEKAALEREKLSKGRTITYQVINSEQDASEAELNLLKLRAEQRKLEARARMFIEPREEEKGSDL